MWRRKKSLRKWIGFKSVSWPRQRDSWICINEAKWYFSSLFWLLLKLAPFFEVVAKFGLSLKSNHHEQIQLAQIIEKLVTVYILLVHHLGITSFERSSLCWNRFLHRPYKKHKINSVQKSVKPLGGYPGALKNWWTKDLCLNPH